MSQIKGDIEVEKVWEEFWAPIVLNADGSVNLDQVKKELYDFRTCIEEVTKVYDSITNGQFSKPTTTAAYVIDAVEQQIQNGIRQSEPWIRVEDGLPDDDIEVEAYMEVSDNFEIAARDGGRWYQVGSDMRLHGISHWRDLVGPEKGEVKDA